MDQSQPVVPAHIYQLRVALRGVSPLIWRRLLVRSAITLAQLHDILQAAFTWSDYHLHRFRIQGKQYGSEGGDPRRVRLTDFRLHPGERFSYFYNFIDDWECEVRLEEVRPLELGRTYPVCIGGKRAAPPEDCGGAWSYLELLDKHKYHPPWEDLSLIAEALGRFLESRDQQSLEDLNELRDAADRVKAYQEFQPDRLDRRQLNEELRLLAQGGGEA